MICKTTGIIYELNGNGEFYHESMVNGYLSTKSRCGLLSIPQRAAKALKLNQSYCVKLGSSTQYQTRNLLKALNLAFMNNKREGSGHWHVTIGETNPKRLNPNYSKSYRAKKYIGFEQF